MSEEFLHFIWQFQLFDWPEVMKDFKVTHPGFHNQHEGPDFLHAKLVYNNIEWNGHVEIHLLSSDWLKHKHDQNEHYKNIILHVVYDDDRNLELDCPTLVLKNQIHKDIQSMYEDWQWNKNKIPCAYSGIQQIEDLHKISWIDRLIIERCDEKFKDWLALYHQVQKDWLQMVWIKVAESFGMKYNNLGFKHLALNIPVKNIDKINHQLPALEAYFFYVSGLIPDNVDDAYISNLRSQQSYLASRFPLTHPAKMQWNFLRMRPPNFPTIRMAQLAHLMSKSSRVLQDLMSKKNNLQQLKHILDVEVSDYWKEHYTFSKKTSYKTKKLGDTAIKSIIVNAVIPLHYFYGKLHDDRDSISHAFRLLQEIEPEKNSIIDQWNALNHFPKNAYETQAYIHLYNNYCLPRHCAKCYFGQKILKAKS